MLKKFATWFIVFGLSFLVSEVFKWTEQGKAFIYIHLGGAIVIILGLAIFWVIVGLVARETSKANIVSLLLIFEAVVVSAITLLATWGATKIFDVDFYVTYQIMTFGQCLCKENKKKDDD